MSAEIEWNGHHIQIICQPMPKYLWMATETAITVDEREIGRAGGFGFTDRIQGSFGRSSSPHELTLEIKVDLLTLVSVPYSLQIDGSIVSQGRLKIDNWTRFLIPIVILLGIGCCILGAYLLIVVNGIPK